MQLSFQKIGTVPATGLVAGRIYFETSTGMIKVATSATAVEKYGDGVKSATWTEATKTLHIINESGDTIDLNLSDVASASSVNTALSGKVDKAAGKQLSTEDYTTADKTKLSGIAAGAQVNVIEKVSVNGTPLAVTSKGVNVIVPAATVTGVVSEDKVISLASGELSSTLSIDYTSADKKINLKGIGGAIISSIDASAFIKDGMVESVAFDPETKMLTITFNTESGKENIEVDLTSLVDTYTAGNGLTLTGSQFSVNTGVIATKASVDTLSANIGTGFSSTSTVAQQLAAVKTTADAAQTAAEVSTAISTELGKLDSTSTGTGNLVKSVTQTDGKVAVTMGSAAIADVTGLQDALDGKAASTHNQASNTITAMTGYVKASTASAIAAADSLNVAIGKLEKALDGKQAAGSYVTTARKVQGHALSSDVTINGSEIAVGGAGAHKADNIDAAVEDLYTKVESAAAAGVQSFGGQTGAITVDTTASAAKTVKFTMSGKNLTAVVNGVAVPSDITAEIQKLDSSVTTTAASGNTIYALTGVTEVDGKLTAKTEAAVDKAGAAASAETNAKAYADSLMTWVEFE